MNETQVRALIEQHFVANGCRGCAYPSIVAGGDNACILPYTANNAGLKAGDLLLSEGPLNLHCIFDLLRPISYFFS